MLCSMPPGVVPKFSYSHNFNTGSKPPGMVEDATRAEMLPLQIANGNRLEERPATGGGAAYWFAQHPDPMGTRRYIATVTVGNRSSGTDRGAVVWVGGTDGAGGNGITNLVFMRIRGSGGLQSVIGTKAGLGAAPTIRFTDGLVIASPGDTIGLEVSESGGIYTYTGYKNGAPLSSTAWTDTEGVAGVPGKAWGCGGYGLYSGSYFPSLGIYAMSCVDL